MHPFFWSLNPHMMLYSTTLLAKPMFKINKLLLIPKTHAHDVVEYSTTSHKICHMENEYNKSIPWHGMEYFQKFLPLSWISSHVHLQASLNLDSLHIIVRFNFLFAWKIAIECKRKQWNKTNKIIIWNIYMYAMHQLDKNLGKKWKS